MLYDAIHGSVLYVADDTLPDGIDEVTITMKHGFNVCKLDASNILHWEADDGDWTLFAAGENIR